MAIGTSCEPAATARRRDAGPQPQGPRHPTSFPPCPAHAITLLTTPRACPAAASEPEVQQMTSSAAAAHRTVSWRFPATPPTWPPTPLTTPTLRNYTLSHLTPFRMSPTAATCFLSHLSTHTITRSPHSTPSTSHPQQAIRNSELLVKPHVLVLPHPDKHCALP